MFEWREKNPAPTFESNAEEYKAAKARWRRRERAAERRSGFTKAEADEIAASDAASKTRDELRAAVPQSLAGLAAKARAARIIEVDSDHPNIEFSLLYDIGEMAGEVIQRPARS
jgi:hypothetical protein